MTALKRSLLGLTLWTLGWLLSWYPIGDHPWFFLVMLFSLIFFASDKSNQIANNRIRFFQTMAILTLVLSLARAMEPYLDQLIIDLARSVLFMGASTMLILIRIYTVAVTEKPETLDKSELNPGEA